MTLVRHSSRSPPNAPTVSAKRSAPCDDPAVRRLFPGPAADLDLPGLAEHYAYPDRRWVRANMVASLDGAVTVDGRSAGLSGDADRRVFRVLRALADVVLVGAGTARLEKYAPPKPREVYAHLRNGRPPAPALAVVSRQCALDPRSPLFSDPAARPVVITCAAAPADQVTAIHPVSDLVVAGDDDVDLPAALAALTSRGWTSILTEGGPRLLGSLLAADLVDELDLTMSPLIVGGDAGRIVEGSLPRSAPEPYALHGLLADGDVLFSRYLRVAR